MRKHVTVRGRKLFPTFRRKGGFALPLTVFLSGMVMFGLYAMFQYFPVMFNQMSRSDQMLNYNMLLASSMDYFKYCIRNRWNWDAKGMKKADPASLADAVDNSKNPYYLERLIFGKRFVHDPNVGANKQLGRAIQDKAAYLGETSPFTMTVSFDDSGVLAPAHPLFQVAKTVPPETIQSITFSALRVHNENLPEDGRTTTLQLNVSINVGQFGLLGRGVQPFAEELVSFPPRTLDWFALYVAGAIRLDESEGDAYAPATSLDVADFRIPVYSSADSAKNAVGITFLSPVFANRGLVLPKPRDPTDANSKANYSATTFSAPVVFGDGRLKERGVDGKIGVWRPASAGGLENQLFTSMSDRFGGLQNGVRVDGYPDRGLGVLFKVPDATFASTSASTSALDKCLEQTQIRTDLSKTAGTSLVIRTPGDGNQDNIHPLSEGNYKLPSEKFSYDLAWSGKNLFVPQALEIGKNVVCKEYRGGTETYCDSQNRYIHSYTVKTDKSYAGAVVDVSITLHKNPGDTSSAVLAQINTALSPLSTLDVQVKNLALADAEAAVATAKEELAQAQAAASGGGSGGSGGPSGEAGGEAAGGSGGGGVDTSLQDTVKAKREALSSLEKARDDLAKMPLPRIAVSTSPVVVSKVEQPNRLRIGVSVENQAGFENAVPHVRLSGYDVGFDGGVDKRTDSTALASNLVEIAYTYGGAPTPGLIAPSNITATYSTASPNASVPRTVASTPTSAVTTADACVRADSDGGALAFPPADWDYPFWEQSSFSMNFLPKSAHTWDASNASWSPASIGEAWTWPVQSIVDTCTVESTAQLVTGFFTCRFLEIKPRSTPLRIIGTFLVGRAKIAKSAVGAGIVWSSIFHPQAAEELEKSGRLGRNLPGNTTCSDIAAKFPIWHPKLPLPVLAAVFACNVNSLRTADPFTWTHLSDCGIKPPNPGTSCSNHDLRHNPSTISFITNIMN